MAKSRLFDKKSEEGPPAADNVVGIEDSSPGGSPESLMDDMTIGHELHDILCEGERGYGSFLMLESFADLTTLSIGSFVSSLAFTERPGRNKIQT